MGITNLADTKYCCRLGLHDTLGDVLGQYGEITSFLPEIFRGELIGKKWEILVSQVASNHVE